MARRQVRHAVRHRPSEAAQDTDVADERGAIEGDRIAQRRQRLFGGGEAVQAR